VGEILVVTYTVAATEELRDRIRRRLRAAAAAFSQGQSSDTFLQALLVKFPDARQRQLFQERLKAALRDYDEAAIFTIHGFCQRMLQENAFESHSLFDTELITDERALREEIADDFWRVHFYENVPELAGYALSRGFNP
ncbi:MAG: exodeoxyribonuclease V subunit beta, partial [Syntrophobacteraceae bacterium CG23_combo_of_CG06-09_8_20_14_all_50_8]